MFEAKYTDVVEALRFDIRNGRFGGRNARLPSFRELSKEYKVSLVTIAKSMNFLQQENVIDIQGTRGAFVKADVTARPRSNDIALIHNFIGDIEGFHAIEALEEYAKEKKMGLLSLKAAESTQYLPELLTKLNADGFIFMHSSLTGETAEALAHAHIPFVSFNRLDLDCVSWVDYDNTGSFAGALKFLLSTGCRRIAHIDFKVNFGNYQAALHAVYRKTLEEAGCFDERLFIARDTRGEMRRIFGQQFLAVSGGFALSLGAVQKQLVAFAEFLRRGQLVGHCVRHRLIFVQQRFPFFCSPVCHRSICASFPFCCLCLSMERRQSGFIQAARHRSVGTAHSCR